MAANRDLFSITVILLSLLSLPQITVSLSRHRRDVEQLGHMIQCQTGRSALDYVSYGCWCGIGGSEEPLDETDQCCRNHDLCYDKLYDEGICEGMTMYTVEYTFTTTDTSCPRGNSVNCTSDNNPCALGLCKCDATVSDCFMRSSFNEEYLNYSRFFGCSTRKYFCGWFGC